jgi:6-phosphofructokinase
MANKTFNSEKVVQKRVCNKCNQTIKFIRVMGRGKSRIANECACGLFIGDKKI